MTPTNRRSPTSTTVHKSAITQATIALEQLPNKPKEVWGLGEALDLILDTIKITLAKGYTPAEIAEMLTEQGISITTNSLKYYLAKHAKTNPTSRSQKVQPAKPHLNGSAPPAEAAIAPPDTPASTTPKDQTPAFRKRGVEEVMSYLLDESDMEAHSPAESEPSPSNQTATHPQAEPSVSDATVTRQAKKTTQPAPKVADQPAPKSKSVKPSSSRKATPTKKSSTRRPR